MSAKHSKMRRVDAIRSTQQAQRDSVSQNQECTSVLCLYYSSSEVDVDLLVLADKKDIGLSVLSKDFVAL